MNTLSLAPLIHNWIVATAFSDQTWLGSFTANLCAGFFVASLVGILIARILDRKSKHKEKEERQERIANLIWGELRNNRKQLSTIIKNMPNDRLVFPALETSVWESIDRQSFIDFSNFKDTYKIIGIYARTRTINKMYGMLLDKIDWVTGRKIENIDPKFMDPFIRRCKELANYMDEFRDEIKNTRKDGLDIFQN